MDSNNLPKLNVTVIGAGKYGSAIGFTSQQLPNRTVTFWARNQETVNEINTDRKNSKIDAPEVRWLPNVSATTSHEVASKDCDVMFLCIPAQKVPGFIADMIPYLEKKTIQVNCAKGMVLSREKFMCQVVEEDFPELKERYCALIGPSFASEVFKKWPTQVAIAGYLKETCIKVMDAVWSPFFKSYWQDDVIGCELAGALKNVLALGAGYIEGLGYGYNTMACFVSRGVKEMQMIGKHFGANPLTQIGLAGAGDVMLTCFGSLSRNRQCGCRLAKGEALEDIVKDIGTVEGIPTLQVISKMIKTQKMEHITIIPSIYGVFYENLDLMKAISHVMENSHHHEWEFQEFDCEKK